MFYFIFIQLSSRLTYLRGLLLAARKPVIHSDNCGRE